MALEVISLASIAAKETLPIIELHVCVVASI